jgi:hypothetical protein
VTCLNRLCGVGDQRSRSKCHVRDAQLALVGPDPPRFGLVNVVNRNCLRDCSLEVIVRSAKFEKLLHELKLDVMSQVNGFAAAVADEIDGFATRKLFGLSSETPSYARLFSVGSQKTSTTHVNQTILCIRALSYFWHVIDRLSFRPNNEGLRAAVLDPIAISLSELLADMLNKQGMPITGNELLRGIQSLSLRYAAAPTLLGANVQDKNSVVWLAAHAIAEDIGYPKEAFALLIHNQLLRGLVALSLERRIKALEAVFEP